MRKTGMKKGEMIMLKKLLLSTALGVCVSQTPVHADTGSWELHTSINRMTNEETITVYVESDDFRLEKALFFIRCDGRHTRVLLKFHTYNFVRISEFDIAKLFYRVDNNSIKSQLVDSRYGDRNVEFPNTDHAIEFAKNLFDKNTLLVDLESNHNMAFGFDISGLSEAIKPVRKACNW